MRLSNKGAHSILFNCLKHFFNLLLGDIRQVPSFFLSSRLISIAYVCCIRIFSFCKLTHITSHSSTITFLSFFCLYQSCTVLSKHFLFSLYLSVTFYLVQCYLITKSSKFFSFQNRSIYSTCIYVHSLRSKRQA